MVTQAQQNQPLLRYLLPLLVTSVLLSLISVIFEVVSQVRLIDQKAQKSSLDQVVADGTETLTAASGANDNFRSSLKFSNFTLSIPEGAVARQADSGGASAVTIYADEDSMYTAEGILYSITVMGAAEFETGKAHSFTEWLEARDVTLTGRAEVVGGLEFKVGYGDNADNLSLYHYVTEAEGQFAHVIIIPVVEAGDSAGEYVQDSIDFSPTEEALENAQTLGS